MEIKKAQEIVKNHLIEIGYTKIEKDPCQAFLHLSEEVGELARSILHKITNRKIMNNKTMPSDVEDELADVFWQTLKLAFYLDIDLESAFIEKYEKNKQKGMPNWDNMNIMSKQQYPEPIVGALIFNPEGKIFLMKSHKWRNKYIVPGGHIELGEKIEDAIKREVKEETGLDIHDIEFISLQEPIFDDEFWKKKHFIFLDFACKTNSKVVKLNDEGQEYVWVSLEEVLKLSVGSYTRRTIEGYIKKRNH